MKDVSGLARARPRGLFKGWPYRAYVITINKNAPGIKARQRYLGKQGLRLDIHNGVDGNKQYGRFVGCRRVVCVLGRAPRPCGGCCWLHAVEVCAPRQPTSFLMGKEAPMSPCSSSNPACAHKHVRVCVQGIRFHI